MEIPPVSFTHAQQPPLSPKDEAKQLIDKTLQDINALLQGADDQNMQVIHDMRIAIDNDVSALSQLMNGNPGAFNQTEMELLNGGQGINFFCQSLDNTYDNGYTEVGMYGGALFGCVKALGEELNS